MSALIILSDKKIKEIIDLYCNSDNISIGHISKITMCSYKKVDDTVNDFIRGEVNKTQSNFKIFNSKINYTNI